MPHTYYEEWVKCQIKIKKLKEEVERWKTLYEDLRGEYLEAMQRAD
jgi:hypothetical protein